MLSGQGATRRARLLAIVVMGALAGTGCIGARSRSDLDQMVRSRGGGISQGLVVDAIDAVGDVQGVDSPQLVRLSATNNRVIAEARIPGQSEELDVYTYGTSGLYGGKGISGPQPRAVGAGDPPIETIVFGVDDVALDRLDAMLDEALAEAGLADAYVEEVRIARSTAGGDVGVTVVVTNDRRTTTAEFGADGTLVAVTPV